RELCDHAAGHRTAEHRAAVDDLTSREHVLELTLVCEVAAVSKRIHQPRLRGAREEGEAESEQGRADGPTPEGRVQLPHAEIRERGECEHRRADQKRCSATAGICHDAGRNLEQYEPG